jgi:hypothetical protein
MFAIPPPLGPVFPEIVLLSITKEPELRMAPPVFDAVLPDSVLPVTVTLPLLSMPPPMFALFPVITAELRVSVSPGNTETAPPEPDVLPPVMVRSATVTVCPFGDPSTRKTVPLPPPFTVSSVAPGPSMFSDLKMSGSWLATVMVPVMLKVIVSVPGKALACSIAPRRVQLPAPSLQAPSPQLESPVSPVLLTTSVRPPACVEWVSTHNSVRAVSRQKAAMRALSLRRGPRPESECVTFPAIL